MVDIFLRQSFMSWRCTVGIIQTLLFFVSLILMSFLSLSIYPAVIFRKVRVGHVLAIFVPVIRSA